MPPFSETVEEEIVFHATRPTILRRLVQLNPE
jgi:hypothetical protein